MKINEAMCVQTPVTHPQHIWGGRVRNWPPQELILGDQKQDGAKHSAGRESPQCADKGVCSGLVYLSGNIYLFSNSNLGVKAKNTQRVLALGETWEEYRDSDSSPLSSLPSSPPSQHLPEPSL